MHCAHDLLTLLLCLEQSLLSQPATQGDQHHLKKRRKTLSSQQGHADSRPAKHKETNLSPLTEPWQAACSEIQGFFTGLAPTSAPDSDGLDDTSQHTQLQGLLHTILAARKVQSVGLTAALCATAGKWVKHVLQQQQQEQSAGLCTIVDLIGMSAACFLHHATLQHALYPYNFMTHTYSIEFVRTRSARRGC